MSRNLKAMSTMLLIEQCVAWWVHRMRLCINSLRRSQPQLSIDCYEKLKFNLLVGIFTGKGQNLEEGGI